MTATAVELRTLARKWREVATHLRRTWWPSRSYDRAHEKATTYAAMAEEKERGTR